MKMSRTWVIYLTFLPRVSFAYIVIREIDGKFHELNASLKYHEHLSYINDLLAHIVIREIDESSKCHELNE